MDKITLLKMTKIKCAFPEAGEPTAKTMIAESMPEKCSSTIVDVNCSTDTLTVIDFGFLLNRNILPGSSFMKNSSGV